MAELGNLTVRYCAPSFANVNCENPRRKPVSHPFRPGPGLHRGFRRPSQPVFLQHPQDPPVLHRMYTDSKAFRLAQKVLEGAKSKKTRKQG